MNYGLLEDEIVARLAPIVTAGHEVEAMPSNQGDNSSVQHKGRITVQVGAAKGDTNDIQSQSATSDQYEDVFVEIIIRSKRLRTNGGYAGIYDLSELARKLLQGWKSTMSWTPFVYVDFTPLAPDNITDSVFTYSLRMKTTTLLPAQLDEDVSVLIEQITVLPDSETGPLAPTGEIYASAYSVDTAGDQIVLAWISENGYNVEINGVGTGLNDSGSATVTVNADTTYTLTVTRGATVFEVSVSVTVGSVCADATVENSDASYSTTVASGGNLVLPDTSISANGDLVVNQPSTIAKDITVRYQTQGTVPTTVVSGEVVVPDATTSVSLEINVYSDPSHTTPITNANFGDAVYVKLTASSSVTTYDLWLPTIEGDYQKISNGTGEFTWVVDAYGSVNIKAGVDDIAYALPFSFTIGYVVRKVLQLDGTQWAITDNKVFNDVIQGNEYTISIRFKAVTLANVPVLISLETGGTTVLLEIGNANVYAGIGGFRTYSVAISAATWHELVFVKEAFGNNARTYLDGTLLSTYSGAVGNISAEDQKIYIGRYQNGGFEFNGQLGDLRIWNNHSASGAQVVAHYNGGVPVHPIVMGKVTHLWYDMNDDVLDKSGNGFDASTVNSPTFITP